MATDGPRHVRRILLLCAVVVAFGIAFRKAIHQPAPARFKKSARVEPATAPPHFESRFVSRQQGVHAHAPSAVQLSSGRLQVFWYTGSREGSSNTEIRSAVFDPQSRGWGTETTVVDRAGAERQTIRYVKKIGNDAVACGPDGRLWLFYVSVAVGGWGGSSITAMTSTDEGKTWRSRRLIASPFCNLSTLVRSKPFFYEDGTIGLPVYQEFLGEYAELLHLDGDGSVLDMVRLTRDGHTLQPSVLVTSETDALTLMRSSSLERPRRVINVATVDAGQHWTLPVKTNLSNPDSALSGIVLADGRILVVLNNIELGRDVLSLVVSSDGGRTWAAACDLENASAFHEPHPGPAYLRALEELASASDSSVHDPSAYARSAQQAMCIGQHCGFEFSYPDLIETSDGEFHVFYGWNRSFIKHVQFNRAWLDARSKRTNDSAH
jgi:predicted neuraminidase